MIANSKSSTKITDSRSALCCGTWFRSRLEATWKAYFNAHDIEAEYEQQFVTFSDGTKYLPDFWLPDSRAWVEVKGEMTEADLAKVMHLVAYADSFAELVILAGSPAGMVFGQVSSAREWNLNGSFARCANCDSWTFALALCRYCGHGDLSQSAFIDSCHPFGGCRSRCDGAFLWSNGEPVAARHDVDLIAKWAHSGIASAGKGLTVIGGAR